MTMPRTRLDSWKAIAQYLGRDVTTVRRWEKREGLPVHRHLHHKLGSVYAYPDEIDAWSAGRSQSAAPEAVADEQPVSAIVMEPAPAAAIPTPAFPQAPALLIAPPVSSRARTRRWLGIAGAAAIGFLMWSSATAPTMRARNIVRIAVATTPGVSIDSLVVSPDGAYAAVASTKPDDALGIRRLGFPEVVRLAGTEGAMDPFWSPGGTEVGFFAGGRLKSVDLTTHKVSDLAEAPDGRGGSWNGRNEIIFAPGPDHGLFKVSANGGVAKPLTTVGPRFPESHSWPWLLPDGRHVLYTIVCADPSRFGIHVVDLDSGVTKRVLKVYSSAQYSDGYLLYADGALLARPFDISALEIAGEPIEIAERISKEYGRSHRAEFSASRGGLVVARSRATDDRRLAWFDRSGRELLRAAVPAWYSNPLLTPDERTVMATMTETPSLDALWLFDSATLQGSRLESENTLQYAPVISSSGDRLIYSTRKGLVQRSFPGGASSEPILQAKGLQVPESLSRNGRYLTYQTIRPVTKFDVWVWDLEGSPRAFPLLQTTANEGQTQISPDGRLLAYASDVTGRFEVYVRAFPHGTETWQVSKAGGNDPHWSRDGRELLFVGADRMMNAVSVRTDSGFRLGKIVPLFNTGLEDLWQDTRNHFDVTQDGQRIVMVVPELDRRNLPFTAVYDWAPDRRR